MPGEVKDAVDQSALGMCNLSRTPPLLQMDNSKNNPVYYIILNFECPQYLAYMYIHDFLICTIALVRYSEAKKNIFLMNLTFYWTTSVHVCTGSAAPEMAASEALHCELTIVQVQPSSRQLNRYLHVQALHSDAYKYNFFSTIRTWNIIPNQALSSANVTHFKTVTPNWITPLS